jgi:hypothetical protein
MKLLKSKRNFERQIPMKNLSLIIMLGIIIVIGIGISVIWANEATENEYSETEFSCQNAAQKQHAHNMAFQATLQDPKVTEAIALAKISQNPEDIQDAKKLFQDKFDAVSQQIAHMRASDMGWGNIAKHFDVHPSYLGRGHSIIFSKHNISYSKQSVSSSAAGAAKAKNNKGKNAIGLYGRENRSRDRWVK